MPALLFTLSYLEIIESKYLIVASLSPEIEDSRW
ncbi:hypothetical protein RSC2_01211 [Bacillus paralicheniformis]|nr:hypothetical protein RSC1_03762 [Bacillus paralicheniformis]BCE09415.1 hypothetical protein RSC2_01211 [Bacillus paralicheniformis]BCE15569.1 hypothetical protein RSC3_02925 [Bacillus paralicheniformis]